MSARTRRLIAGAALAPAIAATLAACSSEQPPESPAAGEETIACAVGGSAQLRKVCTVERSRQDGALTLVVHHPDGGFRRFDVRKDGTGLAPSDGADEAVTRLSGNSLSVTVGPDSYVFPAVQRKKPDKEAS